MRLRSACAPVKLTGAFPRRTCCGQIAKARAGNPEPPLGFAKLTLTVAPVFGTCSRFARIATAGIDVGSASHFYRSNDSVGRFLRGPWTSISISNNTISCSEI
jgi:hypothetical protein